MVRGIGPCRANSQAFVWQTICMACMHKIHLMTPQGSAGQMTVVYSQSYTFLWLILHIFGKQFSNYYIPTYIFDHHSRYTSQRKLTYIQRCMLLNYYYLYFRHSLSLILTLTIAESGVLLVQKFILLFLHFPV